MNKLTIIFLLFPFLGYSQSDTISVESLKKQLLTMRSEQEHIKICLSERSEQYSAGTKFLIAGISTLAFAGVMDLKSKNEIKGAMPIVLVSGSILSAIGIVIHIDSNKWFKRISRPRKK